MRLVIAPEPAAWVEPLLASLPRGETVVIAPWRQAPRAWRLARGLSRRTAVADMDVAQTDIVKNAEFFAD